ncbi:helix-turn-helix domain-containing protein [Flavobacterium foetidum]|uniref:helix-turn-helix domain-containing protein n=1 Tax=Flavobacterium foetidum TaxID=2026681 RepID=UPI001074EE99|nr:AraC family transcriptional regulator [Flavobacterium foetidum]KAF2517140.1 helix-turn-helix transcriptional regulator [Flavobacterium foetidum]
MTLDNWPKHIQKYLFLLKDGFFQFPYLFNTPQIMLESILKLPITRHFPLKSLITFNTPLCKAKMYYKEFEEGFWLLTFYMTLKENIMALSGYDTNKSSEYYLLTFSVFEYQFPLKDGTSLTLLSTCWTISKPGTEISSYFYKEADGKFFSIAMTKSWVKKNFSSKKFKDRKTILNFFNGKRGSYTWLDISEKAHQVGAEISEILERETNSESDNLKLKKKSMKLITEFFDNAFADTRIEDNISLSNLDYLNVSRAERIILQHLHLPFIGIEHIAKEVNTSPTKLKSNFKAVYGFSMLQYHKEKNLVLAMQLVQKSDFTIQEIAVITGHDSAGRFASSYKKRFGKLPSEERFLEV